MLFKCLALSALAAPALGAYDSSNAWTTSNTMPTFTATLTGFPAELTEESHAILTFVSLSMPEILQRWQQEINDPTLNMMDLSKVAVSYDNNQAQIGLPNLAFQSTLIKGMAGDLLTGDDGLYAIVRDAMETLGPLISDSCVGTCTVGEVDLVDSEMSYIATLTDRYTKLVISAPGYDLSGDKDTIKASIESELSNFFGENATLFGIDVSDIIVELNAGVEASVVTISDDKSVLILDLPAPEDVHDILEYAIKAFVADSNLLQIILMDVMDISDLAITVESTPLTAEEIDDGLSAEEKEAKAKEDAAIEAAKLDALNLDDSGASIHAAPVAVAVAALALLI